MNEPDRFTANTPNYRYGFLAAAVHRLLERPIGSPLSPEELRQLFLAKSFLSDVLAGARLVSKGETRSVSASRAIGALDYALGPLQAMEELRDLSEERLLLVFTEMLRSIDDSIRARHLAGDEATLRVARGFFGYLNQDILAALSRQHREPAARVNRSLMT
jgi:hypothetical protein